MTITQLIQSSPAHANELFAKLAATSSGAVKTRESLFTELKSELELQSRLEEEHLFPVLKKHGETKELVRAAVDDNKQARALLADLDGIGKESDEFLAKLEELRKAFQQHVRDEKKDLLPAVKAALSNEEAQAVAQKIEADKAAVEEAKHQEAEERRAAARQEREKAERRRAQAEARRQRAREEEERRQAEIRAEQRQARAEQARLRKEAEEEKRAARETGETLARAGESLVRGGQTAVAKGGAAAQAATQAAMADSQQVVGAVGDALGQTGTLIADAMQSYSERAQPAIEGLQRLAALPTAAAGVAAETGKTWFDLMNRTAQSRSRRTMQLLQSFTPQQAVIAQTRYLSETVHAWTEANARLVDISVEAYRDLLQPADREGQGAGQDRPNA